MWSFLWNGCGVIGFVVIFLLLYFGASQAIESIDVWRSAKKGIKVKYVNMGGVRVKLMDFDKE